MVDRPALTSLLMPDLASLFLACEYVIITHDDDGRSLGLAWQQFAPSRSFRRVFDDLANLYACGAMACRPGTIR
jgi:hypothetical protein